MPTTRVTASSGGKFERDGEYKPGMKSRKDMLLKTKSEFLRIGGQYHATGTKASKADRVQSIEQMLEDPKA
jgi:hypothetical protein